MMYSNLREAVNSHFSVVDLIRKYFGEEIRAGATLLCPFHEDRRKSAKCYSDNAIYCFTESKMYRPYDIMKFLGYTNEQLAAMVPAVSSVSKSQVSSKLVSFEEIKPLRILFMRDNDFKGAVMAFYSKFGRKKNGQSY